MQAARQFPITSWTLVLSAGQRNDAHSSDALALLCERYWYPLYAYIRRRGYTVEQAQDLTQEFFARVLEKSYFERADRHKGRFRTFLLSSLTCFLFDDTDHRQALKRGGPLAPVPFEVRNGEEIYPARAFPQRNAGEDLRTPVGASSSGTSIGAAAGRIRDQRRSRSLRTAEGFSVRAGRGCPLRGTRQRTANHGRRAQGRDLSVKETIPGSVPGRNCRNRLGPRRH
jgi:hypothetical protein